MADGRGMPLLSGPPPPPSDSSRAEMACRKCNKEFNIIFARARKCNHCGYSYCHTCSDYQALMPRSGSETGYDVMNVCAYCIEYLTITAAGRSSLKAQPLAKLKKYVNAYNIKVDRVVEKDDLIDRIIAARGQNGCLSHECEAYYRRYSIPSRPDGFRPRGIFSRSGNPNPPPAPPPRPGRQRTYEFPRPDLAPDDPPQPHQRYPPPPNPPPVPPRPQPYYNNTPPRPPPRPQSYHSSPPTPPSQSRPQSRSPPPYSPHPETHHAHPPPPPPRESRPRPPQSPYQHTGPSHSSHNLNTPPPNATPRPRASSAAPPPSLPPPTLDELLAMPPQAIAALSIGNLKAILFTNHVNAGLILEKGELVTKVKALVEEERRDRERQRILEEQEEQEAVRLQRERMDELDRKRREREPDSAEQGGDTEASSSSPPPPLPPKAEAMAANLERTGLCVICQDEEANIAIVDCGHLAMCRACSELVMDSSRECPLCRTRIVTEARLLRIFKT